MAGNEKLYQMAVLNIVSHSNTHLPVECSFFSLPCVSTHLLRDDREKDTVKKTEKTFYENQAV